MVPMHKITIDLDDKAYEWLNDHIGGSNIEDFVARVLGEYIRNYDDDMRIRGDLAEKLEELEKRIKKLNTSLASINTGAAGKQ